MHMRLQLCGGCSSCSREQENKANIANTRAAKTAVRPSAQVKRHKCHVSASTCTAAVSVPPDVTATSACMPRLVSALDSTKVSDETVEPKSTESKGPLIMNGQVLHSLEEYQLELVNSLAPFVESDVLPILKDPATHWQPSDLLPDTSSPGFMDELRELRERADMLPDEYFVVLVGDMITEEALPTYMAMLNTLDGVRDDTGASQTPWGRWTRSWVAEENRHGDLLNKYCFLSGRVNFKAVGLTIQNLIRNGMEPKTENNPYKGFIYTTFQERATRVSHGATARQALGYGDRNLAQICAQIAGDEARHEKAYSKIIGELFRLDPSGAMLAFSDMMHKQILMPAHNIDDGEHSRNSGGRNLFKDYSSVAQNIEVYTSKDYLDIFEHLVRVWRVPLRTGLSVEALKAQEDVCNLLQRFKRLSERQAAAAKKKKRVSVPFSWVYGRDISVAM